MKNGTGSHGIADQMVLSMSNVSSRVASLSAKKDPSYAASGREASPKPGQSNAMTLRRSAKSVCTRSQISRELVKPCRSVTVSPFALLSQIRVRSPERKRI